MSDFYTVLVSAGLQPTKIVPDGKWYRCRTSDKMGKRNGAYLLDPSGRRGVWKNWATDLTWNTWGMEGDISLAEARRQAQAATVARVEALAAQKAAIASVRLYWDSLKPLIGGHPYLEAKGLGPCQGIRSHGELLVIPVMRDGRVVSVQTITPDGTKRYRTGCPIKGGVFLMNRPGVSLTCFVEGFATGLAVFQALRQCRVVVCFDAGNLVEVAKHFQGSGLGAVCADNDHETEKRIGANKGLEAGHKAAELMGCGIAYPEGLKGSDWADAVTEFGPDAMRWIARKINMKAKPFRRPA